MKIEDKNAHEQCVDPERYGGPNDEPEDDDEDREPPVQHLAQAIGSEPQWDVPELAPHKRHSHGSGKTNEHLHEYTQKIDRY